MKRVLLLALCACASLPAADKTDLARQRDLDRTKAVLDAARDSLQGEIAARWRERQRTVAQRESDKEELDRRRDEQERAYNDFARVKEECFATERSLDDARTERQQRADEWEYIATALDEVLAKEADGLREAFPLDREQRRKELESIRRDPVLNKNPVGVLSNYIAYVTNGSSAGCAMRTSRQTVLPDDGDAQMMSVARFGDVFGYGMTASGAVFLIRQTGSLGADRYAISPVGDPKLTASLRAAIPGWVEHQRPTGLVPIDVLQNAQSRLLIAGKRESSGQRFVRQIKAGGAVMVPLLLLPIWALVLVLQKAVQVYGRRRTYRIQHAQVMGKLDKNDFDGALAYARQGAGCMARLMQICLERRGGDIGGAQQAMRRRITQELPALNRNLNTLAVIAGAAPLLGLLGTISGMITLFAAVTHFGTGDPKFLAGGISEALITAKTGLAVAIPTLFIHDILRNSKDRLLADMERYATALLDRLWPER